MSAEVVEGWASPVNGAALANRLASEFNRAIDMPAGAADACALWVLMAHVHDAGEHSPMLRFQSATYGCGKTQALRTVKRFVPKPLFTAGITEAGVLRVAATGRTLIMDETDGWIGENLALRSTLNSGWSKDGGRLVLEQTKGGKYEPKLFSTWAPKALAGVGTLHPSLAQRSIVIPLRRSDRGRTPPAPALAYVLPRCTRWAQDEIDAVREANLRVDVPAKNRLADNWRPLFAVADVLGGEWPEKARRAMQALSGTAADAEDVAEVLLGDIADYFEGQRIVDWASSVELISGLCSLDDRPWGEYKSRGQITPRQLATILKPFGIAPRNFRDGGGTVLKGYHVADFGDAFRRYLERSVLTDATDVADEVAAVADRVADTNRAKAYENRGCSAVAVTEGCGIPLSPAGAPPSNSGNWLYELTS